MLLHGRARVVLLLMFSVLIMSPCSGASRLAPDWRDVPGTVLYALSLQDGEAVKLVGVMAQRVIPPYIYVRSLWKDSASLPVYANGANFITWASLEITGVMGTVAGQRIVIADRIRFYADSRGQICPPLPLFYIFEKEPVWPYMIDVPVAQNGGGYIPAPLDPTLQPSLPSKPQKAPAGTISNAKLGEIVENPSAKSSGVSTLSSTPPQIQGGEVDLEGKIVTAIFQSGNPPTVASFYIQERIMGGNGIRVIPQTPISLEIGDIVRVKGTVIESGASVAECYLAANANGIERTGYTLLPSPAGMSTKFTAAGAFGLQQALYSDTTAATPIVGAGLSPVGTRVRVWGLVTWASQDSTSFFVSDGFNLKSSYQGNEHTGIRLIYPIGCPGTYEVQDYVNGVTGVLGAEMTTETPILPVPVVRIPCGVQGRIIHVKSDSPGPTFDGKTWNTAYHTVGSGIAAATSGDEVWVASGTYEENITLPTGVRLFGSFAGNETVRQVHRAWIANQTILQGDNTDSVVTIASGATENTVLDGFTIQNGLGNASNYCGGGVYCIDASPTISHNIITANGHGFYSLGGGIYCSGGSPKILENTIMANRAINGGGIYCSQSVPMISGNVISNHVNIQFGGGIYLDSCPTAVVTNNTLTRNSVASGGSVYCYNSGGRIANNAISYNTTYYSGAGGIYCYDYESTLAPEITNNTIAYNSTGGIQCNSCSPTVVNNIVSNNSIGVSISGTSNPVIHTNCIHETTPYSGWTTNPSSDLLTDPLLVGVHLLSGSPCIDVGDNSVVQTFDTDIDGQPRKQPNNNPSAVVDIGADEWNELDNGVGVPITTNELDFFSSLVSYCGN